MEQKTQKIYNKDLFVKSGLYNGSLWKYPSGAIMGTDLDQIAERHGFFLIAETKKFNWNEEVIIPLGQYLLLNQLNNQLRRRKIFIIGTDNYENVDPDNPIWFTTMDEIEISSRSKIGLDNQLHLKKTNMNKTTKKQFNESSNNLIKGGASIV